MRLLIFPTNPYSMGVEAFRLDKSRSLVGARLVGIVSYVRVSNSSASRTDLAKTSSRSKKIAELKVLNVPSRVPKGT